MSDDEALDLERLERIAANSGSFSHYLIELAPGAEVDCDRTCWQDSIAFLLAGELHVECACGESHCFRAGDIFTLAHLPVRRAYSGSAIPTRLLAVRRGDSTGEPSATKPSHQ
jgi:glyoxylate utilization-related uncharacterized protein